MSSLSKRYKARRSRREQLLLERWAQERAKGRGHYLLRHAFFFVVLMIAFRDIYTHFFGVNGREFGLAFYIVQQAITGIFVGYFTWGSMERKYKEAQLKRHLQTPFDDRILPR